MTTDPPASEPVAPELVTPESVTPEPECFELPDAVRRQVLALAASVLGELSPLETPAALRRVREFAPARRAAAGAGPLAAALEQEVAFRHLVAAAWRERHAELAAVLEGTPTDHARSGQSAPDHAAHAAPDGTAGRSGPGQAQDDHASPGRTGSDADPQLLAGLYLLRPPDWAESAGRTRHRLERHRQRRERAASEAVEHARANADADRFDRVRADLAARSAEVEQLRAELAGVRRELRRHRSDADRARAQARAAEEAAASARAEAQAEAQRAAEQVRAASERVQQAEDRAAALARAGRAQRTLDEVRVRLLLDTVVEAAGGLRRELALPPADVMPADLVLGQPDPDGATGTTATADGLERGRTVEDPGLLTDLLTVPRTHLIVDGYNVTKTGYPTLPLVDQRRRLVEALAPLATRTGAEITCCFDGSDPQDRSPGAAAGVSSATRVRGVRVIFSAAGTSADELIRRLVRNEPAGRPVVVVSSDGEVVAGVRRAGAKAVASTALLGVLGRG